MQPNLLNSIFVEIEQIDEDRTVYNDPRRQPGNVVVRKQKFKIKAQIYFTDKDYINAALSKDPDPRGLGGAILKTNGYILVRKIDLAKIGKTLKNGDKLVSYGDPATACAYYLVGNKEAAHYADKGTTTLVRWYFEDRN